jgi:hypothetical protein
VATANSRVRVVAIVSGVNIDPNTLNYRWQNNGQELSKSSGVGKNTLEISADLSGKENVISVQVTNDTQTINLTQTIREKTGTPRVVFYQDTPLTGVNYQRAIGGELNLSAPEIRLLAEPYFFPQADVQDKRITYNWRLNGQTVAPDSGDNRFISFTAPEGITGASAISLSAQSLNNIFQKNAREFRINFGVSNFDF